MMYREYKEKLERRKRTFDRLWYFRYLFLAIFLVILAATGALLGIGGIVYDVEVIPGLAPGERPAFVYGQIPSPVAKAIYGEAHFEYRALPDGEWTGEAPYLAGKYECRAVGTSVTNTDRPGKSIPFEIAPLALEINVVGASLIYGDIPQFEADLLYGDTLQVENWVSEPENGRLNLSADLSSVTVLDKEGRDVTYCYEFGAEKKNIADIDRPAVVGLESETLTYDGEAHSLSCYAKGLAEGDTLKAEAPKFTDAGSYTENFLSYSIVDAEGKDVTEHYKITEQIGTLTILRRPMSVTTHENSWVYDGAPHFEEGFDAEAFGEDRGMLEGHTARAVDAPRITNVSESGKENAFGIQIFDGSENVTGNYQIAYTYGELAVTKRPVNITTRDGTWVYDGTAHAMPEAEAEAASGARGLLEGHTVQAVNAPTVTNVSESGKENEFTVRIFSDSVNVTNNYEIGYPAYGSLTVTKRPVNITTRDGSWVYDGTAHSEPEVEAEEAQTAEGERGLLEGHTARAVDAPTVTDVSESGKENEFTVQLFRGSVEVTGNYEIGYPAYGKLAITPRPIQLQTATTTWIYDAEAHSDGGVAVAEESENQLIAGHELKSTVENSAELPSLIEVGTRENRFEFTWQVFAGEADMTRNYALLSEDGILYGTLKVDPRPIQLQTATTAWVYDAEAHSDGGVAVAEESENQLIAGHKLKSAVEKSAELPSLIDVGTEENRFEFTWQVFAGEVDMTRNYVLLPEDGILYGTLTVTARHIQFKTRANSWAYDAEAHSEPGVDVLEEGPNPLVEGHELQTVATSALPTLIGVERVENRFTFAWQIFAGGEEVTSNYEAVESETEYSEIEVTKRPVKVTTHSNEADGLIYDAMRHEKGSFDIEFAGDFADEERGLLAFHWTMTAGVPGITNVRESGMQNMFDVLIFDAYAEDVSANYEISYTYGTLTISPRPIRLETASEAWIYDAEAHSNGGIAVSAYGPYQLVEGHEFRSAVRSSELPARIDVGETENNFGFTWQVFADGEDVTENYTVAREDGALDIVYGTLRIDPRPILLRTTDGLWIYDDTAHSSVGFEVVYPAEGRYPLVAGHQLSWEEKSRTEITEFSTAPNVVEADILITADGRPVTGNYVWEVTYGTLTVLQRPMSVTTHSKSWVYDAEQHSEEGFDPEREGTDRGLLERHTAEVLTRKFIQTVAESGENEFEIKVLKDGDVDVSANYDITYTYGTITILRRPMSVTTATKSWVYDAQEHSDGGVAPQEEGKDCGILTSKGHTAAAIDPPTIKTVAQAGMSNSFKVKITDISGADVTQNYEISYTYGKLSLTQRPVTVTTHSKEWTYDGEAHAEPAADGDPEGKDRGLIAFHRVEASGKTPSVTNVWDAEEKNNQFTVLIFEGDTDVTENYDISYTYGTITIAPRPIQLKTAATTWIYDAEAHSDDGVSVVTENNPYPLVAGHELKRTVEKSVELPSLIDVGTKENRFEFTWKVFAGEADMTRNYVLFSVNGILYGTIKVDPRPIQLRSVDAKWVYDDTAHDAAEFEVVEKTNTYYPLVKGHTYRWDETGRTYLTEASSVPNELTGEITVWADGRDVSTNYKVTIAYGTLTVLKRPVKVTTDAGTWNYDAMPHSAGGFEIEEESGDRGLLRSKNHTATAVDVPSITDVKENCANKFAVTIANAAGDVTDNYQIAYTYQRLQIKPIPLTITTKSYTWVYDAEEHTGEDQDYEVVGLVEGQGFTMLPARSSIRDAGTVKNEYVKFRITPKGDNGSDISQQNYAITYHWGTLTVKKRPVAITTPDGTWTYDGTAYYDPNATAEAQAEERGLLTEKGHFLSAIDPPMITNVWENRENIFQVVIYDASGNDITENYEIKYHYGVLTIEQRKATVTTNSHTWVYSEGEQYYDDGFEVEWQDGDRGILYGYNVEAMSPLILTQITDSATRIGTVENKFGVIVTDGETDYTRNYKIEYIYGALRVKAPVVVRLYQYQVAYDGNLHTYKNENGKTRYKVVSVPVDVKKEQVIFDETFEALTSSIPVRREQSELWGAFSLRVGQDEINRIDFTGSATPFIVSPRTITVTSQSISMVKTANVTMIDGSREREGAEPYSITYGSLVAGHTLSCTVTGVLYGDSELTANTFDTAATRITDESGYDVTAYYNINYKEGTLRWVTQ